MERIDKTRKGVVWGMMTPEEQECLRRQEGIEVCLNGSEGVIWVKEKRPSFIPSQAYWCPDWDEPTGEELVDKCCVFWDSEEDTKIIGICNRVDLSTAYAYGCENVGAYMNAKLATQKDFDKLMEVNNE